MFSALNKDNGYLKTFLRNCCKPVTSLPDTSVDEVSTAGFALAPHIRDVTEPIERILATFN